MAVDRADENVGAAQGAPDGGVEDAATDRGHRNVGADRACQAAGHIHLGCRLPRIRRGGTDEPGQVGCLHPVRVDEEETSDAEVGQALHDEGASSAHTDDTHGQPSEPMLGVGSERPNLPIISIVPVVVGSIMPVASDGLRPPSGHGQPPALSSRCAINACAADEISSGVRRPVRGLNHSPSTPVWVSTRDAAITSGRAGIVA